MKAAAEPRIVPVDEPYALPLTDHELESVREQLSRLLASQRFQSSKRCQSLLRYVVEQTLLGHHAELKERSLGIEVFDRNPAYDTNQEPVVRVTAGEVRKRLAQYYYDPAHENELRIELPTGSYVPQFHLAPHLAPPVDPHLEHDHPGEATAPEPSLVEEHPAPEIKPAPRPRGWMPWAAVLFIVAGVATTAWLRRSHHPAAPPPDGLASFWMPLLNSQEPILLSIGQIHPTRVELDPNGSRSRLHQAMELGKNNIYPKEIAVTVLGDATAMANVAALLRSENRQFSIRGEASSTFEDLQRGPFVLIGAYNNDWTIRLTDTMRFQFQLDNTLNNWWVSDRQRPGLKIGYLSRDQQVKFTEDYAIVARVTDPTTKQPAVIVAGITPYGTKSAGEFVTNPAYFREFSRQAPAGWEHKNIELVIETSIIEGETGPPKIVAAEYW